MTTMIALALSFLLQAKESSEFDWWANHKVGSTVKLKMEAEANGVKILIESTHTLLEVSKEKALVEQKTTVSAAGQAQPEEVKKEEILKGKDKNPIKIEKEGDEEIEVAGKKLKCHWIQGTQNEGTKIKFWLSKEVPGGEIPGALKISAVSWEKK